jgi:hypothetical protein
MERELILTAVDCLWMTSWQTPSLAISGMVIISIEMRKLSRKNIYSATRKYSTDQ